MRFLVSIGFGIAALLFTSRVFACGGLFCQILPIDQAGEQIIFRQDGNTTTAMVRILYTGEADDFGWVLPVPQTPELSIGSDITFSELELLTRPQFTLERKGEACPSETSANVATNSGSPPVDTNQPEGVTVEETLSIGPFDAQIISSQDPDALATWLMDNNLDLSERGSDLLAPYITMGMKFVVLKLQSNKQTGDIQPIVLKYESEKPMIPIKLTAIAAQEDMGILVWLLGDSRAVPDNVLHVTPNYTRLNWYTGSRNAYASYQTLITEAMNEAGGQGFATDFAGRIEGLTDSLTTADQFTRLLESLESASNAEFIQSVWQNTFTNPTLSNIVITALPLPDGQNARIYEDAVALATQYSAEVLATARQKIESDLRSDVITPLENTIDLLDDDKYMTRLYTTLSPEEMLTDPTFSFNPDMPDQALERNALLVSTCTALGTQWNLILGEGTGREDSVVIDGRGQPPVASPTTNQEASWQIASTFDSGLPKIELQRDFSIASVGQFEGKSGGGRMDMLTLILLMGSLLAFHLCLTVKEKAS